MFAAPFENITAYPAVKDILASRTIASRALPSRLIFAPSAPTNAPKLRTVLRHEFNFSRNCAPIFKFSPNLGLDDWIASDLCMEELRGEFLGIRGMRAYDDNNDPFILAALDLPASPTPSEFSDPKRELDLDGCRDDSEELRGLIAERKAERRAREEKYKQEAEPKSAMATNKWWHDARHGFADDAKAWKRIREAMARGCCRIVAREVTDPECDAMGRVVERGAQGDGGPVRRGLKRGRSARQGGKGSALCRGLDRGRRPSSLSEMERHDGESDGEGEHGMGIGVDGKNMLLAEGQTHELGYGQVQ
jgi:hypothetical protein